MRNLPFLGALILAVLVLGLAAAAIVHAAMKLDIGLSAGDDATRREIDRAVAPEPAVVDFSKVVPFAWTRVYFFGPYADPERDFERVGIHWHDAHEAFFALLDDGAQMIVFVRGDEVVSWVDYTSSLVRFDCLERKKGWARSKARFRLVHRGLGFDPYLRLVPPVATGSLVPGMPTGGC